MAKPEKTTTPDQQPLSEPKLLREIETPRQICVTRFAADGRLVTAGHDAIIHVWDLTGEEPAAVAALAGHHGWLQNIEFAPDGKTLLSADSWGQLAAWNLEPEQPQQLWSIPEAHDGWIRSLAVSVDGRLVATCGNDLQVRVHQVSDGKQVAQLTGHTQEVFCVGIHPSGKSVVSGDLLGNLKEWDLATGKCVREKQLDDLHFYDRIQDVGGLRILKFHDDGKTLLCAGQQPTSTGRSIGIPTIHFLDWESWDIAHTYQAAEGAKDGFVFDITWHPEGFFVLVTSGQPGAGKFMLLRPGEKEAFFTYTKMTNCHTLALHPAGRKVVAAATNRGNQGNGTVKDKEGNYRGNYSPLYEFELPDYKV